MNNNKNTSGGDTSWLLKGKYGIFMHYQYRIMLGYCYRTNPQLPQLSEMTADGWNRLVDGFDADGFAKQMEEANIGWVIFGVDDAVFGWKCAPNSTFDRFTGYAPGMRCSKRDLIADVVQALRKRGVRVILYYAGLVAYDRDKQSQIGGETSEWGKFESQLTAGYRGDRIAVLKEYCDRYGDSIDGWWFDDDGRYQRFYNQPPNDYDTIAATVRSASPKAIIALAGSGAFFCHRKGVDDFTNGDTWGKEDLKTLTPAMHPAEGGIIWHGKIYCGDIYHGLGNANQFDDQELIDWIITCNRQGGVVTMDWPFNPKTGLLKDFGIAQLKRIAATVK